MSYFFEQSELELGKKKILIGGVSTSVVLMTAYFLPSDMPILAKSLSVGLFLMVTLTEFMIGIKLWRKKSGIWRVIIDDFSFEWEYPSGSRFECKLTDIQSCRRVKSCRRYEDNEGYSYFLLFHDSTYRQINLHCDVDYQSILDELKKHVLVEDDYENRDTKHQYPYQSFLKSKGFEDRGLTTYVFNKANWK